MPTFTAREEVAYSLGPLKIKPTADGYLLREKAQRTTGEIGLLISGGRAIHVFLSLGSWAFRRHQDQNNDDFFEVGYLFEYIVLGLVLAILTFLLPQPLGGKVLYIGILVVLAYFLFGVIYWLLCFIFDQQIRHQVGFNAGLGAIEILFSHYPLKAGEGDRPMYRRSFQANFWTKLLGIEGFPPNSRLRISLICIEREDYNTDVATGTKTVKIYHQDLKTTNLIKDHQLSCYFDLNIPAHLPPSLEARHNQIRWLLEVEEIYPNLFQKHTYLTFMVDSAHTP